VFKAPSNKPTPTIRPTTTKSNTTIMNIFFIAELPLEEMMVDQQEILLAE